MIGFVHNWLQQKWENSLKDIGNKYHLMAHALAY